MRARDLTLGVAAAATAAGLVPAAAGAESLRALQRARLLGAPGEAPALVVSLAKDEVSGDPCQVTATLENAESSETLFVVTWGSPFAEVISQDVFRADKKGHYVGPIGDKGSLALAEEEVVPLPPGERLTKTVNVCAVMRFPEVTSYSVSAQYTAFVLPYSGEQMSLAAQLGPGLRIEDTISTRLSSNNVTITPAQPNEPVSVDQLMRPLAKRRFKGTLTTYKCSRQKRKIIKRAQRRAKNAVNFALKELPNGSLYDPDREELVRYFAREDLSVNAYRDADLKYGFRLIKRNLRRRIYVQCGGEHCNGNWAYVYPADPDKIIYVCVKFWESPRNEFVRDSRPGTLIHELSHFDRIARTRDFKYGEEDIVELAKTDMAEARMNADSWQAFAETL